MSQIKISLDSIRKEYDDVIDGCAKYNYYTRSELLQREKVSVCKSYVEVIKQYKNQAIEKEDESAANLFFHIQCMLNAMASSLSVWVSLKSNENHDAWVSLVDAQEYVMFALKTHDYEGVRRFESHLESMENALFPGWKLFNSSGHIESIGDCSICGDSFLKCDHIENKIYMGRACLRVNRKIIKVDHSALVENPKDRRCILTKISNDNGSMTDYFTWEEVGESRAEDGQMIVEGVVISLHNLDLS